MRTFKKGFISQEINARRSLVTENASDPSTLPMIHSAQKDADKLEKVAKQLQETASVNSIPLSELYEGVTHLLARIAIQADEGQPINMMTSNTLGAFLAGVEAIAEYLPTGPDPERNKNAIRVLATAGIGPKGDVNAATAPIISIGAKRANRQQAMQQLVSQYSKSQILGKPEGRALAQTARKLQMSVDRAIRSAMQPRSMANTAPSRGGVAP